MLNSFFMTAQDIADLMIYSQVAFCCVILLMLHWIRLVVRSFNTSNPRT